MANLYVELTYIKFRNPAERELNSIIGATMRAELQLEQALQERFGSGRMELRLAAGGGGAGCGGGPACGGGAACGGGPASGGGRGCGGGPASGGGPA